jgi:hypothetical protein
MWQIDTKTSEKFAALKRRLVNYCKTLVPTYRTIICYIKTDSNLQTLSSVTNVEFLDQLTNYQFTKNSIPWSSFPFWAACPQLKHYSEEQWSERTKKLQTIVHWQPITVAARSKAGNVFARSNTGIVGSNPTQGMDVCLRLFCVCVVLCR